MRIIRSARGKGLLSLAVLVALGSLFLSDGASAQTTTASGYTVPTVGKIKTGQAGVIFDNTAPLDWTGHLTAGGFGSRVVPKITDWFALPNCESTTQLYCIAAVSVAGKLLQALPAPTAIDNNPLARSAGNVKSGIITRWSSTDGKTLIAVNSYANFRCDLNCQLPDVSSVAVDARAYKVVKGTNFQALGYWDVYSALMGGHPEDQQLFRDCVWLDKGTCGKVQALPVKDIAVSLQLPVHLRTAFPGPDVLTGHFNNVYLTESAAGTNSAAGGTPVRTVTVTASPATVGYFAGVLNEPLPSWAVEGRVTILNPEDGNTLPITSNGAPTGTNGVWQFALNETASANDSGSCLGKVTGTAVVIGSNSSNVGHFDWVATTDARFSTQDFPRNLNLTNHYVQNRVMLRNDFASCMVSGNPSQALTLEANADYKLGTTDNTVNFNQWTDSNNGTWLIKDIVYLSQVTSSINVTLSLKSSASAATGLAIPKPVILAPQKAVMVCTKKSGGMTYKATVNKLNPKCPSGYKFVMYLPSGTL